MNVDYIDSHQHFWKRARGDYSWLSSDLGPIYRDFQPSDLQPLLAAAGISRTILVQAAASEAETHYMLKLAAETDFISGVVGWVDMAKPDASECIASLAQNAYFKGIRPMIQDIEDSNWMLKPELDKAFMTLIDLGLSFDALVLPRHLPNLLILLQRYPELLCVIDHAAKPSIESGDSAVWSQHMAALASQTSAYCKISGLVTEAGEQAHLDGLTPYFQHLYQCFGVLRLMWGSDWPVLNLAMDYVAWHTLSQQLFKHLGSAERQQIMATTASSFYRL